MGRFLYLIHLTPTTDAIERKATCLTVNILYPGGLDAEERSDSETDLGGMKSIKLPC